jgi:steroid delta-isomerase-like uncharacterized protein
MVVAKNKALLKRYIEEVWNQGHLDLINELVGPQYVIHHDPGDPWEGKTLDLATCKKRISDSRRPFPDLRFDIQEMIAEGEKVAISWYMSGTQQGHIPGLSTTNNKIKVSGLTIYFFAEGKITGHWQVFDKLSLMTQLGVQIGRNKD